MHTRPLLVAAASCLLAVPVSSQCEPVEAQKIIASDGGVADKFGVSATFDGQTAVIGSMFHDHAGPSAGAAYVYELTASTWTEKAELRGSDTAAGDEFGFSVRLDGDTLLVGARADDDNGGNSGSAFVFVREGSSWVEQQKLLASDGMPSDLFGYAVDLDGDTAVVGATNVKNRTGAAYVFVRNGTTWTEQQKLEPSDGEALDGFGWDVALENDTLAIGSIGDDDNGDRSGSVYMFRRSGTTWTEGEKLIASDGGPLENFGESLAMQGEVLFVGVPGDDDKGADSGSAYVFMDNGALWEETQKLVASDGVPNAQLGESVAIDGDFAVIGAWNDTTTFSATGSAYVYSLAGTTWVEKAKLVASDAAQSDNMGSGVGIVDGTIFVGSLNDDDNGNNSGSAYVFEADPSAWSNYGQGWPGTFGIPNLRASAQPTLGTDISLLLGNSRFQPTAGFLIGGAAPASVPLVGGTRLVAQTAVVAVGLGFEGLVVPTPIPSDAIFCGVDVYFQLLVIDPGASQGVSFSRGLVLRLGG